MRHKLKYYDKDMITRVRKNKAYFVYHDYGYNVRIKFENKLIYVPSKIMVCLRNVYVKGE